MIYVLLKSILAILIIFLVLFSFVAVSIVIIYLLGVLLGSIGLLKTSNNLKELSRKWYSAVLKSIKGKENEIKNGD